MFALIDERKYVIENNDESAISIMMYEEREESAYLNISAKPRSPVIKESRCMNVSTAMTSREKIRREIKNTRRMLFKVYLVNILI